jgi:chromosome segregation ATPase
LRDRVSTIQSELEFHEEKVKKMKEQFKEWKKYIDSFNVQLNKKIDEIDIEKKELQRAKNQI